MPLLTIVKKDIQFRTPQINFSYPVICKISIKKIQVISSYALHNSQTTSALKLKLDFKANTLKFSQMLRISFPNAEKLLTFREAKLPPDSKAAFFKRI